MKTSLKQTFAAAAVSAVLFATSVSAASAGYVDFDKISPSADSEYVEVDLNRALLRLAAVFVEREDPAVADVIRSLEKVRVNVLGLGDENRDEARSQINAVRDELDRQGWSRVVTVREGRKHRGDDVAVFIKENGEDAIHGLVVTVMDGGNEAVFVNIVGDVKLEQIAAVGEGLDIEALSELKFAKNR